MKSDPFNIRPDDHFLGPKNAPVRLIEYADFECPYCREGKAVLHELRKRLGNEVCFVFRNFPLEDVHENAELAARAVEAAHRQGKFWEMHDVLFENQEELGLSDILGYASELGLDVDQFEEDLEKEEVSARVRRDGVEGEELGADSTPTLFINGTLYEGSFDVDSIEDEVNRVVDSGSDQVA